MSRTISTRLARLERHTAGRLPVVVIIDPARSIHAAIAAYEAEHGSTDGCIRLVVSAAQRAGK